MSVNIDRRSFVAGGAAVGVGAMALPREGGAKTGLAPAYPMPEGPVTRDDYLALKAKTEEVYGANRVTIQAGTFHVPTHGKYSSLFAWDSGWHAIAMSRVDPAIAASEIDALTSLQLENGRVSHDTHFPELEEKANWVSKLGSALGNSQFDEMGRSAMIDPPSYVIAAERIFEASGDREWLGRVLPRLERCLDYLAAERDLFGDGLVSVIHPWETGTDSSPAYDDLLNLDFRTPLGGMARGLKYPRMLDYNARFGWDPQEARRRNKFVLEDSNFNAIVIRALLSVARLNEAMGDSAKSDAYASRARDMVSAMDRINWVEEAGCYFSRYDAQNPKLVTRTTLASIMPILTGLVEEEKVERMIAEHLTNPDEFGTEFVVSFNAKDELAKEKIYLEDLLLWRGHCIWTNMNWMIVEGLNAHGKTDLAREITRRTAKMILHEGFWEFYDFRNGQGKGQPNFNWPGLVLDMIHTTWPEAASEA